VKEHILLSGGALVVFVGKWAETPETEADCGDETAHPELDERWMLWVDSEVAAM
jgi:hypothetical protein